MKGYGLLYYFAEAFRGIRANGLVNLLAVGTICMAMLIVGVFLLALINLQGAAKSLSERLEMSVYLKDGLSDQEKDYIFTRLRVEQGVNKVSYLSKVEALEIFKKELKGQDALMESLGDNPLPDSYEIGIDRMYADSDKLRSISEKISRLPGVEDVSYGREGAEALAGFLNVITYGGLAFGCLIGVSVVFIISNSVRLALYSRGQEIELMQWIGATRSFIQGPFLIEGALLAATGTALAVGVIAGLYFLLPEGASAMVSGPNGVDFLPAPVVAYMITGGGLLGLIGGLVAANNFLE